VIVAAIKAGKIERLAKHSQSEEKLTRLPRAPEKSPAKPPAAAAPAPAEPPPTEPASASSESLDLSLDQMLASYLRSEERRERLGIELLTTPRFVAGEQVTVRAAILFDGHRPVEQAMVKLQIVGTTIKPQSFVAAADRSGLVSFTVTLPPFTSGTAALILQASEPKGQEAEAKFLIRRR
jgi:hypothetical protein